MITIAFVILNNFDMFSWVVGLATGLALAMPVFYLGVTEK
jgi:hypothetical protein